MLNTDWHADLLACQGCFSFSVVGCSQVQDRNCNQDACCNEVDQGPDGGAQRALAQDHVEEVVDELEAY